MSPKSSNNLSIHGGPRIELGVDDFSLPDAVDQVGGRFYQKYGLEVGLDIVDRFHLYTVPGLTVGSQKQVNFSYSSTSFQEGGTCPDDQKDPFTGACVGDETTGNTSSTLISTHGWDLPLMVGMDLFSGPHGAFSLNAGYAHGWGNFADNLYPVGNVNYDLDTLTTYQTNDFQVEVAPTYKSRYVDASLVLDGRIGEQKTTSVHSTDGSVTTQSGLHCQGTAGLTVLFHPARKARETRENSALPPVNPEANQKAEGLAKDFKIKYATQLQAAGITDIRVIPSDSSVGEEGETLVPLGIEGWYYFVEVTTATSAGPSTQRYHSLEELQATLH